MKQLFRNQTPDQKIVLAGKDLTGEDLSNSRLDGVCFEGSLVHKTNFSGCMRNGKQVLKFAQAVIGDIYVYGFLCQDKKKTCVLINEPSKKEYEFKLSGSNIYGKTIHALLTHG